MAVTLDEWLKKESQGFMHTIAFMKYRDNPLQQSLKRIKGQIA